MHHADYIAAGAPITLLGPKSFLALVAGRERSAVSEIVQKVET